MCLSSGQVISTVIRAGRWPAQEGVDVIIDMIFVKRLIDWPRHDILIVMGDINALRARVCVCVRAHVRDCVRACVRSCMRAYVCLCV